MKHSIPHEPTQLVKRNIPSARFSTRTSVFSRIEGLNKKTRVLSVLSYLGLGPFLWLSGISRQRNSVLKHHVEHSLGFALLLLIAIILYEMEFLPAQFVNVYVWKPSLEEYAALMQRISPVLMIVDFAMGILIAYFGIHWVVSLISAWRGKAFQIPFLSRLISRPFAQITAAYWFILVDVSILVGIFMSVRSIELASRPPSENAKVYVLYTIGGYIPIDGLFQTFTPPRWVATLGFYPLVAAGIDKYGEDGVAVLPMTEENFSRAIGGGKFIFIASHGGRDPGSFSLSILPDIEYLPSDIQPSYVGEDLQFVYFSGCYTGILENEWKEILRLDDAILFDRLSAVDEHMLWAWFASPGVIKNLQ